METAVNYSDSQAINETPVTIAAGKILLPQSYINAWITTTIKKFQGTAIDNAWRASEALLRAAKAVGVSSYEYKEEFNGQKECHILSLEGVRVGFSGVDSEGVRRVWIWNEETQNWRFGKKGAENEKFIIFQDWCQGVRGKKPKESVATALPAWALRATVATPQPKEKPVQEEIKTLAATALPAIDDISDEELEAQLASL